MPNKIETWECCVCGTTWETEEKALTCESKHKKIVSYEPMFHGYPSSVPEGSTPDYIRVTFEDGTFHDYSRGY